MMAAFVTGNRCSGPFRRIRASNVHQSYDNPFTFADGPAASLIHANAGFMLHLPRREAGNLVAARFHVGDRTTLNAAIGF